MLPWIKTDRSPLTFECSRGTAWASVRFEPLTPTWIAQLNLPAGGSRMSFHRSQGEAQAWCEGELARCAPELLQSVLQDRALAFRGAAYQDVAYQEKGSVA